MARQQMLIAGGGIGGMAAALACAQQGMPVQLIERNELTGKTNLGSSYDIRIDVGFFQSADMK